VAEEGATLTELVGTLSLAADLGLGQPMEHIARSCLIAVELADRLGADRRTTYQVALLAFVGCTADSHETALLLGDDITARARSYDVDLAGLSGLRYLLGLVATHGPPLRRARTAAALVVTGGAALRTLMATHCQVTGGLAARLGLDAEVSTLLGQTFARWDGRGVPGGVAGEQIGLPTRIVQLADDVEVHHRRGGVDAALAAARAGSGREFDPAVVAEFLRCGAEVLDGLPRDSSWAELIAADPAPRPLTAEQLDAACEAVADFVDVKSPWFAGHSRGVADLAAAAARRAGHPEPDVRVLRRAGLLHDLGRTGVPNTILDKPGPLTAVERERVELHSYYTDRMLRRVPALAAAGRIAALAHERLDGSGYHRGLPASAVPAAARILAAADTYHAMIEARPHRPAHSPAAAAAELRAGARGGAFDPAAVEAVLGSAGHRARRASGGPAGLTAREVQVLVLLSRAASTRQIARRLAIAPKTVDTHIERIYTKVGARNRPSAALFAMQHGLLTTLEPVDP
jgi:HD-GYP domain-containing protein (c-di-GMP phosphodiesterase class II)